MLVPIDHQPFQFANLHSHEPTMIVNDVIALLRPPRSSAFDFFGFPEGFVGISPPTNP